MNNKAKKEQKKLQNDYDFLCMNKEWWEEQMGATLAEIDYLQSFDNYSARREKRLEFLTNRLTYLQNKARLENKISRKFQKRVKNFESSMSDGPL